MEETYSPPVSPTKAKSLEIKAINKETVHRICSGQVVLNLATAIKELVENSLDAGATTIEIRLREYGSEFIEVSDNGSGVQEENFEGLTLKHHTSKLQEFSDLVDVETFGFRGEALSSLCALSEMTVTTKHASSLTGTRLVFDSNGHVKSKIPCARQIGTTVTLANLFSTLPVRQKEFLRNLKREFVKMTHLLYGYCLIASHAKISCNNQTKKGSRTVVVSTQGNGSVKDNIACIFGAKQVAGLLEMKQETPSIEQLEELGITRNITNNFHLDGCISSCAHGQGRSSADRQFYYINSRPCEPTKVAKVVNEIYHQFNVHQFPFVFLNISTARSGVDVNVTPDKRQIFLENEKVLLASIKATLLKLYENIPSTYQMQIVNPAPQKSLPSLKTEETMATTQLSPKMNGAGDASTGPRVGGLSALLQTFSHGSPKAATTDNRSSKGFQHLLPLGRGTKRFIEVETDRSGKRQMSLTDFIKKDSSENIPNDKQSSVYSLSSQKEQSEREHCPLEENAMNSFDSSSLIATDPTQTDIHMEVVEDDNGIIAESQSEPADSFLLEDSSPSIKVEVERGSPSSSFDSDAERSSQFDPNSGNIKAECAEIKIETRSTDEVRCKTIRGESEESCEDDLQTVEHGTEIFDTDCSNIGEGRKSVRLQVDISEIKKRAQSRRDRLKDKPADRRKPLVKFYAEIDPNSNKNAEQELNREISKDMFAKMTIVGQFNLGFIVTHLGNDLFIVDQHATDEKYNFETLQRTTVLQNQKLVIPQTLELTSVNEGLLMDNLEVFRKNGFDFKFDENGPATRRVQLTAKPYSHNWEFGREDIDELLFMLSDAPNTMCRPSRVRAMFASRACRKSVMIGTALSKSDMRRLINHMGEIEQPWNCPHGRPTMRHLVNLEMVRKK